MLRFGLLICGLLLPTLAAAAPPAPKHGPTAPPLPADRFSVDTIAAVDPAQIQMMKQAGTQMVRYYLSWNDVQPTANSPYDWSRPDSMLNTIAAQQLDAQVILTGNPAWAATNSNGPVDRVPLQVYYNYVSAAAARYSLAPYTVRVWEIYNEPDDVQTFGTQGALYAQILTQDYGIIKGSAPNTAVVMGGLGYDNFTDERGTFVRSFLADVLAAGGGAVTDAVNFHHYPSLTSHWTDLRAVVAALHTTMAAAGVQLPLIWTETGAPTDPHWGGSVASQADYVLKAYAGALALGIPLVTWFPIQDFNDPTYGYFSSHGLLDINGVAKPSLTAYRVAAGYLTPVTFLRAQTLDELGGDPAIESYSFLRPNGSGLVVAWTNSRTATALWPAAQVQGVRDVYDQPVSYTTQGTQAVIALSTSPVYIQLVTPSRFADVPLDSWYQPFVEALVARGAISGYADGTFRPFNNTTRGQISKMVSLAMGWPIDTSAGQVFADVLPTDTYYSVVETAFAHGIISGYACGGAAEPCDAQNRPYFRPNNNVTRGQLSKMLTVAKGWTPVAGGVQDFGDVPSTYPLYGFIEAVFQHGVVSGYGDGTFRPGNNATRAQLAKMIQAAVTQP